MFARVVTHRKPRSEARSATSIASRVFPTPGAPQRITAPPDPRPASSTKAVSRLIRSARPMSGSSWRALDPHSSCLSAILRLSTLAGSPIFGACSPSSAMYSSRISSATAFDPAIAALSARASVASSFNGSVRKTCCAHRSRSGQRASRRARAMCASAPRRCAAATCARSPSSHSMNPGAMVRVNPGRKSAAVVTSDSLAAAAHDGASTRATSLSTNARSRAISSAPSSRGKPLSRSLYRVCRSEWRALDGSATPQNASASSSRVTVSPARCAR